MCKDVRIRLWACILPPSGDLRYHVYCLCGAEERNVHSTSGFVHELT